MRRLGLLAALLATSFVPSLALAATGGITISPPVKQVVLRESAPTPLSFSVTNNSVATQKYRLRVADFKSLAESGGVAFIGQDINSYQYGLAKSLRLDEPEITLAPGETREVKATIPGDVSPGGHYSAILLAADGQDVRAGSGKVSLEQVASILIFAIKSGGAKYDLRFDSFVGLPKWSLAVPEKLRLRLHNTGNVHVVPRGLVEVSDPTGKVVGQGTINNESGFVLPDSHRQFAIPVQRMAAAWLPGRYQVKATYRYEGTDVVQTSTRSIMVFSWYSILVLIVLGAILIAAIVAFASTRLGKKR